MSRKGLCLVISICLVGAIFLFVMNKRSEKTYASGTNDMFQEIDSAALAAKDGQQNTVGALVDTIFVKNGITELEPNLVAALKDRIVRAELNGQLVSESQVMEAFNWLAGEFSAPTYARISPLQTRVVRQSCSGIMPNLFVDKDTQGNVGSERSVNGQLSSEMPATEAVTLLILMVHQKVLNEEFQKEPSQWDTDFYAAQEAMSTNQSSESSPPEFVGGMASQKTNEMQQLVYGSNLSQADQEMLMQGVLDQLGIPR